MNKTPDNPGRDDEGWRLPAGSGDRWADDYEAGRPGYPREAAQVPGLQSSAGVLDLGAGTGKLTRVLVSACERGFLTRTSGFSRRPPDVPFGLAHRRQRERPGEVGKSWAH
jgi:hypothetical protein